MPEALLKLSGVHTHIAQYHILQGKTTTLRTIMGMWRASRGEVRLGGRDIAALATPEIARAGVAYVPESMAVFSDLTVRENLLLGARQASMDPRRLEWILGFLPALRKFWNYPAGNLSGGQKQMVAIARAIIEPRRLLLVDEPTKGLAPAIVQSLLAAFRELKATGTTILLVEQNVTFVKSLGDSVAVMDDGRVVHAGSMRDFAADHSLQERLLGLAMEVHS